MENRTDMVLPLGQIGSRGSVVSKRITVNNRVDKERLGHLVALHHYDDIMHAPYIPPMQGQLGRVRHYVTSSVRHIVQPHQDNAPATTKWRATTDTAYLLSIAVTATTTVATVPTKEDAVSW